MAVDVTVIDKAKDATTYGTLSSGTFTTNATSGMAGVTISGISGTTATTFSYGACLSFTSVQNGTVTMTAPTGYIITGYTLTARSNTYAVPYTLTPSAGGSAVTTSTGGVNLTASGLSNQTASFTFNAGSANSFYIPSLVISVMSPSAQTVNVTYELWDNGGSAAIDSEGKVQEVNSAISVPASWTSSPIYTYDIQGSIGDTDCTIRVIRTKIGATSTDDLKNTKCYTIRTYDRGWWVVPASATQVTSTTKASLATDASDLKQRFAFITYDDTQDDANDGIYLYSVSEKKFISRSGSYTTLTATPGDKVTLPASTGDNNFPTVVALNGYHAGVSNGYNPAVITSWQSLSDGGNRCAIVEAADFDATEALTAIEEYFHPNYTVTFIVKDGNNNVLFTSDPVGTTSGANITTLPAEYQLTNFYEYNTVDVTISTSGNTNVEFTATPKENAPILYTSDTTSPIYYNLNIRSKYLVYNSGASGEVTLQSESEPFNADASWAFIGEPYAGFKLINKTKGADSYLTYTSVVTGNNHGNNNIQFVPAADFTNQYWIIDTNSNGLVLRMKENNSIYFHHDNGNNFLRTCSVSEYGSVHNDAGSTIQAVSDNDVLFTLYDAIKNITFGEGLGEYTAAGISIANAQATISNVGNVINTSMTSDYADAYAELKALAEATDINLPAGKFIRLYSPTSNLWMGSASSGKHPMVENKADAGIYFVTSDNHIVSYNQGLALANAAGAPCAAVGNAGGEFSFGALDYDGTYYVYCGGYLIAWTDNYTNRNSAYDNKADWNIEEVTELPVTISAAGYATLYAPVALNYPSVVTVSTVTINSDGATLDLAEVTGTIPANTPVLLAGKAGTYNFDITAGVPAIDAANVLVGTTAAIAAPDGSYILQNQSGKVGFYQVDVTEAQPKVPGFRAYLNVPSSPVKAFFFGEADGISAVAKDASAKDATIFNIAGQRVAKAQKGIYIVNGKKVLVK